MKKLISRHRSKILFKTILILISIFFILINSGCLQTSGQETHNDVSIGNLTINCSPTAATECDQSGKTFYIGLTDQTDVNCENFLFGINNGEFTYAFLYSGTTVGVFTGTSVQGSIQQWVNTFNQPVTSIESKNYKVCGFMDVNNNGILNSGEPLGEGYFDPSETQHYITDWFSYFFLPN